jgi:hypothetical protein
MCLQKRPAPVRPHFLPAQKNGAEIKEISFSPV